MKRSFRLIVFMVTLFFVFAILPTTNAAVAGKKIEDNIKVTYIGNDEVKEVNFSDIKNNFEIVFLSKEEKIMYIFEKLNIDNIEYSGMFAELVEDFDYLENIISSTAYYEIDNSDGTSRQISKSECLSKASGESRSSLSIDETTVSGNGYMSISTSAIAKTNEELGTYSVLSTFTWLRNPLTRSTDAVSLASDIITWYAASQDCYSGAIVANVVDGSSEVSQYIETKNSPDYIYSSGFYFSFDLPNDIISLTNPYAYHNISMIISGKGRVSDYDDATLQLSLSARYAHVQIANLFAVSFSWGMLDNSLGVTIDDGAIIDKYYYNYLSWDYIDHFYSY